MRKTVESDVRIFLKLWSCLWLSPPFPFTLRLDYAIARESYYYTMAREKHGHYAEWWAEQDKIWEVGYACMRSSSHPTPLSSSEEEKVGVFRRWMHRVTIPHSWRLILP